MSGCLSPAKHGTNIDDARVFLKGLRSISLRNLTVRAIPSGTSFAGSKLNTSERDAASVSSGSLPNLRAQLLLDDAALTRERSGSCSSGLQAGPSSVLLTTGIAQGTVNPTWAVSETSWLRAEAIAEELERTHLLLLRVFAVDASADADGALRSIPPRTKTSAPSGQGHSTAAPVELEVSHGMWDCVIDVRGLTALPSRTRLSQLWTLPADCLLLEMSNGDLYAPGWVVKALDSNSALPQPSRVGSGIGIAEARRDGSHEDEDDDQEPIDEVLRKVLAMEKEAEIGRKELSTLLQRCTAEQMRSFEADRLKYMTAKLAAGVSAGKALLEAEDACLENEKRQLQNDASAVEQLLRDLSAAEAAAAADARELEGEKREALKSRVLLEARRARLTAELQAIYPIKFHEKTRGYTIRGLELPADLYSVDDERVSSALGYTAHLVCMLAKYLQVPLRYQLIFNASRSAVRDNVTGAGVAYPLFRRGVEKERFDRGVFLLARDVEQMLTLRGVRVMRGVGQLLPNLERLMAVESA